MDIGIDFDGTCVTHEYPRIGKDIGAVPVLKELVESGHNLILVTIRSDIELIEGLNESSFTGNYLSDALRWFRNNQIKLYGVQINPTQSEWTTSPKAYAHLYIDDSALGCPLIIPEYGKPYVDWKSIRTLLIQKGILKEKIRVSDKLFSFQ